jgi:hypothetical protein
MKRAPGLLAVAAILVTMVPAQRAGAMGPMSAAAKPAPEALNAVTEVRWHHHHHWHHHHWHHRHW